MRNLKFGYLWVLLIFFVSGYNYSISSPLTSYPFTKQSEKELKIKSKISGDTHNEKITIVRKRKARGVSVAIPQISEVTFIGIFTYNTFKFPFTQSVYSSLNHCYHLKRGPPLV